jgi:hypothetical protein
MARDRPLACALVSQHILHAGYFSNTDNCALLGYCAQQLEAHKLGVGLLSDSSS